MKKIQIILLALLISMFSGNTSRAQVQGMQVVEQVLTHADTLAAEESSEPITKTVVMEEDEVKETELTTREKWITGILAALGVVGVIVIRLLRKKKKVEKKPE